MVEHHTDDESRKDGPIGRRGYLTLTAAAIASAAGVGNATATGGAGEPSGATVSVETDRVVDLGAEGLTPGDEIDPYLDDHFENGVEVRIPEGEYDWNGGGFHNAASRDAAVVGMGEVVLHLENSRFRNDIDADDGVVALRNLTIRGKPSEKSRFRLQASSSGHVLIDNVDFPDGSEPGADSRPFYSPSDHAGVVEIRNCYFHNFSNNGIYASSPGKGSDGQLIIENCVAHNNNIAGIRIGSSETVVRNCVVLNDDAAPENHKGQRNMRGIRVREAGNDILIENCEIIHSYSGAGAPIQLHDGAEGGSGTIVDTKILNNTGNDAIGGSDSTAEAWSARNVSISGDGDLGYHSNLEGICTGSDCHDVSASTTATDVLSDVSEASSARVEPDGTHSRRRWTGSASANDPTDSDTEPDSFSDSADVIDGTVESETWNELVIVTENATGSNYDVTTTGQIRPEYERAEHSADRPAPTDYVQRNVDGTWTAIGSTSAGGPSGDTFRYRGRIVDVHITGELDGITVRRNGSEVPLEDLVERSAGESASLPNRLLIDGTGEDGESAYQFTVSGDVRSDSALSSSMAISSERIGSFLEIDRNTVRGLVGTGLSGFRFSGEIVDFSLEGDADVTVEESGI
ncbi:MAG: right-handed parallel beta-helix repeat-containing protein [Halobacteriota archaeon]